MYLHYIKVNMIDVLLKVIVAVTVVAVVNGTVKVETDADVYGVYRSTIELPCRFVDPPEYRVQRVLNWYMKPEADSEIEQVLSMTDTYDPVVYGRFAGRTELLGVQADLHITQLELSDAGEYTCEVYFYAAKETGLGTTIVHISQLVDQISIVGYGESSHGGRSTYYFPPDEPIIMQCEATLAKPAATLTWYKGLNEVEAHGETIEVNPDGSYNTISLLQFTPQKSDHGTVLKCESNQEPDLELAKSTTLMINTSGAVSSTISVSVLALSLMVGYLSS